MGAVVVICLGFVFVSPLNEILAQYKTKEVAMDITKAIMILFCI